MEIIDDESESVREAITAANQILHARKTAYQLTFTGETAQAVLADLAKFCRAHESTFTDDPRAHAVLEGRREVWLRIQHQLQLTDDQIWKLYGRK